MPHSAIRPAAASAVAFDFFATLTTPAPDGLMTVWAFLYAEEPQVLGLMLDPLAGLLPDDQKAAQLAYMMGAECRCLLLPNRPDGFPPGVGLYPREVLEAVFPINP